MRSTTFTILASLLAGGALAAPIEKRDVIIDNVVVTEDIIVEAYPDGSYSTLTSWGTSTLGGVSTQIAAAAVAVTPTPSSASSLEVKVPVSESSAPVLLQKPSHSYTHTTAPASVAPTSASVTIPTVSVPVVSIPSVSVPVVSIPTAAPAPTTLATSVAATSTAAPVPTTSTTPVSSGVKRGLAYNDVSLLADFVSSSVSWCYNWGASPGGTVPTGLTYVPMLWGLGDHVDGWTSAAQSAIDSGSEYLLAFNEPDQPTIYGGSAISVSDAVTGWSNMEQFAGKAKLGAPAVSNGGFSWLTQFLSDCSDCTIDFIPIHWYDTNNNFEYFQSYISQVHEAAPGKALWITEFAATGSLDVQTAFAKQAMTYLDSLDYVERYSYFFVADGKMVTGTTPNELGQAFAGLS